MHSGLIRDIPYTHIWLVSAHGADNPSPRSRSHSRVPSSAFSMYHIYLDTQKTRASSRQKLTKQGESKTAKPCSVQHRLSVQLVLKALIMLRLLQRSKIFIHSLLSLSCKGVVKHSEPRFLKEGINRAVSDYRWASQTSLIPSLSCYYDVIGGGLARFGQSRTTKRDVRNWTDYWGSTCVFIFVFFVASFELFGSSLCWAFVLPLFISLLPSWFNFVPGMFCVILIFALFVSSSVLHVNLNIPETLFLCSRELYH